MRRTIATVFSLFAAGVFLFTVVFVYDAYYGVPEGLTGGRNAVALPARGSVKARGGIIRRVEGFRLELRALAPNSVWTFSNRGGQTTTFTIEAVNVKPSALRVEALEPANAGESATQLDFSATGPNAVEFALSLPPRSRRRIGLRQVPQTDGRIHFYVFGHARNGLFFLQSMQEQANEELPDFIIGLGDNYYRSFPDKILDLDARLARTRVPVYLMPGEIEYREQDEPSPADSHPIARFHKLRRHAAMFGPGDQAFDYGGWRFVLVENGRERNVTSLHWLRGLEASEADTPRTLFFSHIPPYDPRERVIKNVTTGTEKEHEIIVEQMQRLNVAAAFFDHYRWFDARRVEGIPTYVTSISSSSRAPDQAAHFLDVTLENGRVRVFQRPLTSEAEREVTLGTDGAVPAESAREASL